MILDSKVEPSFTGKVALIVGASRGIGAVTARAFAQAGAAVVVAARDRQALDSVVEDIRSEGGQALGVPTEVTDASSVEHLVRNAISSFGRLDAAFNNATDGPLPALLADIDPGDFDRGIRTNILGTFLGMKYQIPAMLQSGGGAIVNHGFCGGTLWHRQSGSLCSRKVGNHWSDQSGRARLR